MDISSVQKLCIHLISSAYQRCRLSEDLCRLSVLLESTLATPIVRVSISDTGTGSCLEEFQDLKYSREGLGTEKWDGLLSIKTTSISDNKIYHYHLNLRESGSSRRLTRLPSIPKNDAKFSGTEVYLSISDTIDALLTEIKRFFQKQDSEAAKSRIDSDMLEKVLEQIVEKLLEKVLDDVGTSKQDCKILDGYNAGSESGSYAESKAGSDEALDRALDEESESSEESNLDNSYVAGSDEALDRALDEESESSEESNLDNSYVAGSDEALDRALDEESESSEESYLDNSYVAGSDGYVAGRDVAGSSDVAESSDVAGSSDVDNEGFNGESLSSSRETSFGFSSDVRTSTSSEVRTSTSTEVPSATGNATSSDDEGYNADVGSSSSN